MKKVLFVLVLLLACISHNPTPRPRAELDSLKAKVDSVTEIVEKVQYSVDTQTLIVLLIAAVLIGTLQFFGTIIKK